MERKQFSGPLALKAAEGEGLIEAVIATLNVVDADGDVLVPGLLGPGGRQNVRVMQYGHRTADLPVGKGVVREIRDALILDAVLNLETPAGADTFRALKFDLETGPPLEEWSFTYDAVGSEPGEFRGQRVRFLRRIKIHSADPVFLGSGVDTRTVGVKSATGETARRLHELEYAKAYVRRERLAEQLDDLEGALGFYFGPPVQPPYA